MKLQIRPIEPKDNEAVKHIILAILESYGCIGPGFASSDPEIEDMFTTYALPDARYWVLENSGSGQVIGGGGFSRLKGTSVEEGICELQKLYFLPQARGYGFGKKMLQFCIEEAKNLGYQEMYLETIPEMLEAIAMYQKFGFERLSGPKGKTGHNKCPVQMNLLLAANAVPH